MKKSKIYAEVLEPSALEQYEGAMALDCVVQGALMPDAHTGYTLPIGSVIATDGTLFPSWVGYDIGCGMVALPIGVGSEAIRNNAGAIFEAIYRNVPTGFAKHNQPRNLPEELADLLEHATPTCREIMRDKVGRCQLGTLGSGNHFIEVGSDENDIVYVVIHSGSRGIGHAIATKYMQIASGTDKAMEGHFGFAPGSAEFDAYRADLAFCLAFALENRKRMAQAVVSAIDVCGVGFGGSVNWKELINRNHNHAEMRDGMMIHRKGATHAEAGMMGVIPGNMRDGSFIVRGKGNPDSLFSSSHGAGRVMSRSAIRKQVTMDQFTESMAGITARVNDSTLDESPFAYKDIFEVMRQQQDLVEVVARVVPIINVKGDEIRRKK
jgi:tRNA-splicing ligase RtcB (3'-phosphate/5'-hydroxy nucleic acid ligase)